MRLIKQIWHYKRSRMLLLLPICGICILLGECFPAFAEYVFARGLYRGYGFLMSLLTRWLPFSLAEIGCIVIPALALFLLIRWLTRLALGTGRRRHIFGIGILNVLCLCSLIVTVLTLCCFMNIRRIGIGEQIGLESVSAQDADYNSLKALSRELVAKVNALRSRYTETYGEGVFTSHLTFQEKTEAAKRAYEKTAEEIPTLGMLWTTPKEVHFSRAMSYLDVVGMYVPFTMEANINTDAAIYSEPKTICHEMAHIQGYIKEDEANFIAYLVCRNSEEPEFQYSAYISAMILTTNALYQVDADAYREIMKEVNAGVRMDLDANNTYWDEIRANKVGKAINEAASKGNDVYLKISGQKQGVKSYGMAVDLILADYIKNGEI